MPNCKDCRYRFWLANLCHIHIEGEYECDEAGTELCKKMNDPDFIQFMKDRGSKI